MHPNMSRETNRTFSPRSSFQFPPPGQTLHLEIQNFFHGRHPEPVLSHPPDHLRCLNAVTHAPPPKKKYVHDTGHNVDEHSQQSDT